MRLVCGGWTGSASWILACAGTVGAGTIGGGAAWTGFTGSGVTINGSMGSGCGDSVMFARVVCAGSMNSLIAVKHDT